MAIQGSIPSELTVGAKGGPEARLSGHLDLSRVRIRQWLRILLGVGSAQAAVHAMGFVAGIWIIRCLAPGQYALYTMTYAVQGMLNVLTDGGISSGAMAEGGKVWKDPRRLGQVVNTALSMRRTLTCVGLAIGVPLGLFLFHRQGASWVFASGLLGVVLFSFWLNFGASIFALAPALHQKLAETQKISLVQNAGRVGVLLTILRWIPNALAAVAVNAVGQFWAFIRIRHLAEGLIDRTAQECPEVRRRIWEVVRKILPGSVYFCLSGQIGILVISLFGSTIKVAQVGALSRLGQAFAAVALLASTIIVPRFARLPSSRPLLLARYVQVMAGLVVIALVSIAVAAVFPAQVLWLLGGQYSNLAPELLLMTAGSALSLLAQFTYCLGCSRGHVVPPVLGITLEVSVQAILLALVDLHEVRGVLLMGLLMAAFQCLLQSTNLVVRIRRHELTPAPA